MTQGNSRIFSAEMDTADLPVRDQFEFWRSGIGQWADIDREGDYLAPFLSKISHFQTSGLILNKYDRKSQGSTNRRKNHIAGDGVDMIGIDIRLKGQERACRFIGDDVRAKPRDIRIYDLAQPFYIDNEDFQVFSLWVNRMHFENRLMPVEQFHGLLLQDTPLHRVFRCHIGATFDTMRDTSAPEAEKLANATISLAMELLDFQTVRSLESEVISTATVRRAVNMCIRTFMADPGLSPDFIARHVGVSRSKLYRVCSPVGTPMEALRRARLHEAARLLKNRTVSHISNLAYAVGFSNRQAFGRAFKEEFGMSPRDFMAEVFSAAPTTHCAGGPVPTWGDLAKSVETANASQRPTG